MKEVQTRQGCVGIVEDDAAVRRSLCLMLESLDMEVHAYANASEYLKDPHGRMCCGCLILDVRLPGMSGIELQRQLARHGQAPAIVFITGHAEVPMVVEAMRNGAVDFLQKPFKELQLIESVQKALVLVKQTSEANSKKNMLTARLASLTTKEHELYLKLLTGARSKDIAAELGLAVRTIEERRANVMHKMHAATIADLILMSHLTS